MKLSVTPGYHPEHLKWLGENLRQQYWGAWLKDEQLGRAMKKSMCFWLMRRDDDGWVGGDPLGFARIVGDGATFSSLMDVFVLPEYRGLGAGRALVRAAVGHKTVERTICVLHTRDAAPFYAKFGFRPIGGGMMQRDPGPLVEAPRGQ